MYFECKFVTRRGEKPIYWRTVCADGVAEASKIAERWCKKGYFVALVIERVTS